MFLFIGASLNKDIGSINNMHNLLEIGQICIAYKKGLYSGIQKASNGMYIKNFYLKKTPEYKAWYIGFIDGQNNDLIYRESLSKNTK